MSKSLGQIAGGIVGGVIGFIGGGGVLGAVKGFAIGSSIGGMIDPPPGPDLKGPMLEDRSFNSAAYGVSLATLHGTIAHTGSIIYLENNEYTAVTKKQKTGGKGGAPKGSYETTTYLATFAVAIGEAMPGSKLRRIWAGGKLIYSVGESVDWETLMQSAATAGQRLWSPPGTEFPEDDVPKWHYYDGTQNEPDARMEAVLGVGNCPSYEGTAYIIFYDFDLTEYGNGLQGCPIKVEVISGYSTDIDELPFQKILESIISYPGYIYDYGSSAWRQNHVSVRSLSVSGGLFIEQGKSYGESEATDHSFDVQFGWSRVFRDYSADILRSPGLTFDDSLNWHEYDPTIGTPPDNSPGWTVAGWATSGGLKIVFGDRLHAGEFDWSDEPVLGAAYGNGHYFIINNAHIIKLSPSGDIVLSRATNDFSGGTYYMLWYDDEILYRATMAASGTQIRIWEYNIYTLDIERDYVFGAFSAVDQPLGLQFAVYGGIVILGWSTVYDGGKIHYEQWRVKDFNVVQPRGAADIVGRIMAEAGIGPALRDLSELEGDVVDGYRITDVGSARGKLAPLQIAYLFDFVEYGFKIKAVKRGGAPIVTIPLSDLGARAAGDSPGVLVQRERETDSQLPSTYLLTYLDYNREYDTNTQPANYPSRTSNTRTQSLPVVLSATRAAQLADIYINLAWMERDSYSFSLPQKYFYLKPADVIEVEVAAGLYAAMRIGSLSYTADQRLEVSAKRAEPAVYQSNAVGSVAVPPSENIPLIVSANAVIMDIPAISDSTATYGFGVAMNGGDSWRGGVLLRSIDNGQTFDSVQGFAGSGTVARVENAIAAGDYFVIDRSSELTVSVLSGDFFSITESQMLTGKHYCAYGADGRWEIIQYAVAAAVSDTFFGLSTFVRGLFGTEWAGALHQSGDLLVLLDDPDNAFIGADAVALNSPRKFKSVTTGQDAQSAATLDFMYRGINLKPLSPVNVSGQLVDEVWTITCSKRTRMASNQWATGIAAPIGEVALLFEFEIYDGSVFKKMYQSPTETFVYSAVNQMADFGFLPTTLTVKIYQISAVIGRGFGVEKTLIGVGDIYGDKVVFLLGFGGGEGSTNFVDDSKNPKSIAAYGNAKITLLESKFGVSAAFDGVGDYLGFAGSSEFVFSGDFTIEAWVYIAANSAQNADGNRHAVIFSSMNGASSAAFGLIVLGDSSVTGTGVGFWNGTTYQTVALTFPMGVWRHVAVSQVGSSRKIFFNGAAVGSFTGGAVGNVAYQINIGGQQLSVNYKQYLNGYVGGARMTNGVGRYPVDFPPPTQPFPDPI